ncbi:MAG: 30S ribosomal protein S6 [Ktedonobacteraceae bacterium]|nr:30S ribosomal protein S6 [Ktedonobacteraceae bacterium]
MRDYELGFILQPEVSEEETRTILDRIEQIVAQHGGQIVRVNHWGRRRLAYPIERHRDGIYIFIDMILTPETVSEIERTLKVSETILRHMMRRRDPKVVQREREEYEARAAAAASPPAEPETQEAPVPAGVAESTEGAGSEETSAEQPEELPVVSEEELAEVPPAIEGTETSVEV